MAKDRKPREEGESPAKEVVLKRRPRGKLAGKFNLIES